VTDARQQVLPSMSRKWKQINKFLEVVRDAVTSADFAPGAEIRVVDFGAGKGYLTFAAHAYLRQTLGYDARVCGVELRPALVDFCNGVARGLDLAGLEFHAGDIARFQPERLDLLIALHACDTATDLALFQGVRLGARVLIAAPCCHKEVRPHIQVPDSLRPVLRHGIHLGQEADMVTDSLRALCLEACGYETKILEFVALEHTAKNKMILAVKRKAGGDTAKAAADVRALMAFYGIREQALVAQLRAAGLLPG
jgi:SAM-dependent methyltransferase